MKKIGLVFLFSFILGIWQITAQEIDLSQLSNVNVDKLSDNQIRAYWEKAQKEGYTLDDLEMAARIKQVPEIQITKLKQRILRLPATTTTSRNQKKSDIKKEDSFGLTGYERDSISKDSIYKNHKSKIFGYNFFQNPKISFTPNQNMPTPENYVIGPGDELLVEVWGATESNSTQKVDNQGNIILDMVGKIRVGGLTFSQSKERIKSALRQIYSGIGAADGSYNKVYTSVSLANIRTVKVNIIGEVAAPGTYSLSALSTVINALYASGGPTESGSFRNVQLIRNGQKIATFDIYEFLMAGSEQGNLSLNDQDVILVPAYENQVEVKGNVKREGIYELKAGETLTNLERYFGGFKSNAYKENLIIERITGARREVKEIPYSLASSFEMKGGDKLIVHELSDVFHNRLSIGGAVYQPGNYAYSEGMSALDLIQRAAGLRQEAYLDRGIIFRLNDGVEKQSINFSVRNLLNKSENILLQQNDSIHIFHRDSITKRYFVSIEGAVRNPQRIPYMQGIKIEDLIVIAGGFKEGADPTTIQVGRQTNDESFKTISEVYDVSLSDDMKNSSNSIELLPNDIVTVRYKRGYTKQQTIHIQGEVLYPGFYVIKNKDERISDIIARAGGFSPYAYLQGGTLIRKKIDVSEKEQEKLIKELEKLASQGKLTSLEEEKTTYRVGINLEQIIKNKGSYQDLILKEDDVLLIPSEKQTVEVKGNVLSPSMIRYQKGKTTRSYINNAGGFANNAQKRSVYVIYANGDVKGTKKFLFFKGYPKVAPGAVVVVPEKPERKGLTATETVSITTALTTLAILIYNTFAK